VKATLLNEDDPLPWRVLYKPIRFFTNLR
jgi:hypothetical protein